MSHTKGKENRRRSEPHKRDRNECSEISEGSKKYGRKDEEKTTDRSKFKKVEIPIFNGIDPDSWLFRADRYFKIHKLTDSEKLMVAVISY